MAIAAKNNHVLAANGLFLAFVACVSLGFHTHDVSVGLLTQYVSLLREVCFCFSPRCAILYSGDRPLASRGGRHSKDVDKPRRGGLTPLALSSPLKNR